LFNPAVNVSLGLGSLLGDVLLLLIAIFGLLVLLLRLLFILTWVLLLGFLVVGRDWSVLTVEWLRVAKVRHLLVQHVWRYLSVVLVVDAVGWHWLRSQVLVWVETSKSHNVCQV
jgi:hypothetical protein